MKKIFVLILFLTISLINFNFAYSISPDIFVQSTVNRASQILSENISKEDVVKLEIETGVPRTYVFEEDNFTRVLD